MKKRKKPNSVPEKITPLNRLIGLERTEEEKKERRRNNSDVAVKERVGRRERVVISLEEASDGTRRKAKSWAKLFHRPFQFEGKRGKRGSLSIPTLLYSERRFALGEGMEVSLGIKKRIDQRGGKSLSAFCQGRARAVPTQKGNERNFCTSKRTPITGRETPAQRTSGCARLSGGF